MYLLINYTGEGYHWGCYATSSQIYKRLAVHDFVSVIHVKDVHGVKAPDIGSIVDFARSDQFETENPSIFNKLQLAHTIVVNGEGTLHGTTSPGALGLLVIIEAAKAMGIPINLINHSVFPGDYYENKTASDVYATILSGLNFVSVRDSQSKIFYENHGIDCTQAFDCLPLLTRQQIPTPGNTAKSPDAAIVIAGAVNMSENSFSELCATVQRAFPDHRIMYLSGSPGANAGEDLRFARRCKQITGIEVCDAQSFDEFIRVIHDAKIVVSGRFHYNIAAISTETPLISFQSNTPKNSAVLKDVGYRQEVLSHCPFSRERFNVLLSIASHDSLRLVASTTIDELVLRAEKNFDFLENDPSRPRVRSETLGQKINRLNPEGMHTFVIEEYERAKVERPQSVIMLPAYLKVAVARSYRACKRPARAVEICHEVVAAEPGNVSAYANLIVSYSANGDAEKAYKTSRQAIKKFPDEAGILIPAAASAADIGEFLEAICWYKSLITIKPDYLGGHLRLSKLYSDKLQDYKKALYHAEKARTINPDDPALNRLVGENLVFLGDFGRGFCEQMRRLETPAFLKSVDNRNGHLTFWKGEPLQGKLLVMSETAQGIGFELLCASFLPHLKARGIECLFEASERIAPLCQPYFGSEAIVLNSDTDLTDRTDLVARANFSSLLAVIWPDILHRSFPDHDLAQYRRKTLRVGIAWRSTNPITGQDRTIPLVKWQRLFEAFPDAEWVNLQYGDVEDEISGLPYPTAAQFHYTPDDFLSDLNGLIETIRNVDVVVAIDNSAVFFADLIGKPTFVLLPPAPHWIWGAHGSRTQFLPNAFVFRRTSSSDSSAIMTAVANQLRSTIGN